MKLSVYKAVVLATLLYGCEAWACSQAQSIPLESFHMRCFRRICDLSLWQKKTNQEIQSQCRMETVSNYVSFRRLRWLGHVARMKDDRLAKQLLFGHITNEQGAGLGRPQKCWQDYVREDLAKLNMLYNWHKVAQDREAWRSRIQRLLVHT